MAYIAGHDFSGGPFKDRCVNKITIEGVEHTCDRCQSDILGAIKDDIGRVGWCCSPTSSLENYQYEQIERERERIWSMMKH